MQRGIALGALSSGSPDAGWRRRPNSVRVDEQQPRCSLRCQAALPAGPAGVRRVARPPAGQGYRGRDPPVRGGGAALGCRAGGRRATYRWRKNPDILPEIRNPRLLALGPLPLSSVTADRRRLTRADIDASADSPAGPAPAEGMDPPCPFFCHEGGPATGPWPSSPLRSPETPTASLVPTKALWPSVFAEDSSASVSATQQSAGGPRSFRTLFPFSFFHDGPLRPPRFARLHGKQRGTKKSRIPRAGSGMSKGGGAE